ncbi:hypothetical protein N0V90_001908 [Kalmusia sp. IMI 367209]|nr:hypothetical protein N0V90_001908 [Kalmusia sp. IMI 367209]
MEDVELNRFTGSTTNKSDLETQRLSGSTERGETTRNTNLTPSEASVGAKEESTNEYISGFKLFALLGSVTLAAFLMLLDGSIIGVFNVLEENWFADSFYAHSGALTQYTTWRWCFYINLPVGAIVAVLLLFLRVPELTQKPAFTLSLVRKTIPELDLIGFALFAPAATMFLLALHYGSAEYPWNSSVVIGLFCGAGATLVVFILWQRRLGDQAMIPPSMVSHRVVWTMPKVGYYLPFAAAGSAISALGNGLVTMFSPITKTATWIGYQIILGCGRGIGMQMGIIAIQNVLPPQKIPVGIAFMIFCQNFAGAIFTVAAEVIFTQQLQKQIKAHAPSVSIEAALAAGASSSAVRALVPAGSSELVGVLLAFANSVDKVFFLLMACCLIGLVAAFGMGWVDTRRKQAPVAK